MSNIYYFSTLIISGIIFYLYLVRVRNKISDFNSRDNEKLWSGKKGNAKQKRYSLVINSSMYKSKIFVRLRAFFFFFLRISERNFSINPYVKFFWNVYSAKNALLKKKKKFLRAQSGETWSATMIFSTLGLQFFPSKCCWLLWGFLLRQLASNSNVYINFPYTRSSRGLACRNQCQIVDVPHISSRHVTLHLISKYCDISRAKGSRWTEKMLIFLCNSKNIF